MKKIIAQDASALKEEQVRQLYAGIPSALLANLSVAAILAYFQSEVIATLPVLAWVLALALVMLLRLLLLGEYRRAIATNPTPDFARWLNLFRLFSLLTGLVWGLASILLYPNDLAHQALLSLILAGLAGGGTASMGADSRSAIAYALPAVLPLGIQLLMAGQHVHTIMGMMVFIFATFLGITSLRSQRLLLETARLRVLDLQQSRELEQQQMNLRSILDNAPIGIWRQDKNGRLLFVNRWFCEAVGVPEQTFISVPHYAELYDPETAKRCIASDMAAMVAQGPHLSEERIQFTDGALHDIEVTKICLEEHGREDGLIGIATDVTEHCKLALAKQEQEKMLRQILENQTVATFIIDNQHRVLQWNRACEALTGILASEIVGSTEAWRAFYPAARPCLADLVLERATELSQYYPHSGESALLKDGLHAETWFDLLGGQRRFIVFDAAPIFDDQGQIAAVVETLHDITAQKHVEESLRETESRFRIIADSAPVMIWMADADMRCEFFNKTWLDFTGRSLEQEVGDGWQENMHPDDVARCTEIYHRRFRERLSFQVDYRLRRRDGVYRWITEQGIPRFDEAGELLGYIGSCVDIDENKRIQEELRQGRETARQAFEALTHQKFALDEHAIVSTADVQGRITYANDRFCAISGYSREELLGHDHAMLNSGHHPHGFFGEMYEKITHGETWHGEICNRAKDGSLYWLAVTIVPFMDKDGLPEQYISIRTDITARKQAEAELVKHRDHLQELVMEQTVGLVAAKETAEHAAQAKAEFLANMSHELRTPMHAILSFSELGESKTAEASPEKLKSYFHRIQDSGQRLLHLLNDLLDLSKLEAGKMILHHLPHDLLKLTHVILTEFESLVLSHQLQVLFESEGCTTIAEVDETRFMQVMRNLISNAIKFTPPGGTLTLRFSTAELPCGRRDSDIGTVPALRLEVSDSGVGIPEDELEVIFDKFVQSTTTDTKAGGTGLGLAICKEMIEAHHGTIVAHNNPAGGATFVVTLPLTLSVPTPPARSPS